MYEGPAGEYVRGLFTLGYLHNIPIYSIMFKSAIDLKGSDQMNKQAFACIGIKWVQTCIHEVKERNYCMRLQKIETSLGYSTF
ncbi:hypothetical protein ABH892_003189 [Paenibacillus sp. RC254]